jgi:hypothetical protein
MRSLVRRAEVCQGDAHGMKPLLPFPQTFVLTHCNAVGGYLPTRPAYAEGGYEVQSSPFAPGAAETVVEETPRRLRALRQAGP